MKGVASRWAGDRRRRIVSFKPGSKAEQAFQAADLRVQVDVLAVLIQYFTRTTQRAHLVDYRLQDQCQLAGLAAINAWLPTLSRTQWQAYHQGLDALIAGNHEDALDVLRQVQALHDQVAQLEETSA